MDREFKFPATPTMPLFPLSPDRMNVLSGAKSQFFPLSPKQSIDGGILADITDKNDRNILRAAVTPNGKPLPGLPSSHTKSSSDVQGMVARFNSLDIKDHVEARKQDLAALKRAIVGREEAESEARKLRQQYQDMKEQQDEQVNYREEARKMKHEVDERKHREMKMMKRIDVLMEEAHREKEAHTHKIGLYEKEIRKARKEAFKASSTLVKMQEELKAARNSLRTTQSDLQFEQAKATQKEQDAFAAQYELIGIQEDLARARTRLITIEEERDTLKTSLRDEEILQIAVSGGIALPSTPRDDEFGSPKKQRTTRLNLTPHKTPGEPSSELDELRLNLRSERRKRDTAEEQVEFMKMECRFQCCSCRIAERRSLGNDRDASFEEKLAEMRAAILPETPAQGQISKTRLSPQQEEPIFVVTSHASRSEDISPVDTSAECQAQECSLVGSIAIVTKSSPEEMDVVSPVEPMQGRPGIRKSLSSPNLRDLTEAEATPVMQVKSPVKNAISTPDEHCHKNIVRTITTTTTIPLADSPKYSNLIMPSTPLTKEEAIQQLRQRRRARSVQGTPRKPLVDAYTPRRDISAPENGTRKTPRTEGRQGRGQKQ